MRIKRRNCLIWRSDAIERKTIFGRTYMRNGVFRLGKRMMFPHWRIKSNTNLTSSNRYTLTTYLTAIWVYCSIEWIKENVKGFVIFLFCRGCVIGLFIFWLATCSKEHSAPITFFPGRVIVYIETYQREKNIRNRKVEAIPPVWGLRSLWTLCGFTEYPKQ